MYDELPWETKALPNNLQQSGFENALIEIFRTVKFHNPTALLGVGKDDLHALAKQLEESYSLDVVERAKDEILKCHVSKAVTIGTFLEKCMALHKSDKDYMTTRSLITKDEGKDYKSIAAQNIAEIRQMISKAIQPLPYDKNKTWDGKPIVYSQDMDKTGIDPQEPLWGVACYSDGPELYKKLVNVGAILPIQEIDDDPELRELYNRAWTIGLEKHEKARFNELAAAFEKRKKYAR